MSVTIRLDDITVEGVSLDLEVSEFSEDDIDQILQYHDDYDPIEKWGESDIIEYLKENHNFKAQEEMDEQEMADTLKGSEDYHVILRRDADMHEFINNNINKMDLVQYMGQMTRDNDSFKRELLGELDVQGVPTNGVIDYIIGKCFNDIDFGRSIIKRLEKELASDENYRDLFNNSALMNSNNTGRLVVPENVVHHVWLDNLEMLSADIEVSGEGDIVYYNCSLYMNDKVAIATGAGVLEVYEIDRDAMKNIDADQAYTIRKYCGLPPTEAITLKDAWLHNPNLAGVFKQVLIIQQ